MLRKGLFPNFLPNHRLLCACIECLRDAATFVISQSTCKMLEDDFQVAAEVPQHTLRLKNTALFQQIPKNKEKDGYTNGFIITWILH